MNGDNPTSTSAVASCLYPATNPFIRALGLAYLIFDNFEFTGMCEQGSPTGGVAVYLTWGGSLNATPTYDTVENLYFHGWTHRTFNCPATDCDAMGALLGTSHGNYGQGDQLVGIVCDGWDTDGQTLACIYGSGYDVHNSVFRYAADAAITNNTHVFHDNLIEYIASDADGVAHGNGFEFNVEFNATNAVYNNVIRHMWPGCGPTCGQVTAWQAPYSTDYTFNNLVYDVPSNGNYWDMTGAPGGGYNNWSIHLFNNTFIMPADASTIGATTTTTVNFRNNHCVTPNGGASTSCVNLTKGGTVNQLTNIVQSLSTATSQGYTASQTFAHSPAIGTGATLGVATNQQSLCSNLTGSSDPLLQAAGKACQSDTTFACAYNSSNHTVTCPARTPLGRPPGGNWDAGAYQFTPPGSASNLQAIGH
jgi:hypothetical protein